MTLPRLSAAVFGALLLSTTSLTALAVTPQTPLTPERVFSDPAIAGPKATTVKLSPDGQILAYLQPKKDKSDVQDLWAVPVKGGEPFILVDADKLSDSGKVLSEAEKSRRERMRVSARGVVAFTWAEDSKSVLVPLDGDVFMWDRETRAVTRLTETEGDEVDARLSPDNASVSFVRDQTLYVKNIKTGTETAVTLKGADTITYGTAEFIAEEELDRHQGYWWSPTARHIAYQKTDESGVRIAERVEINGDDVKIIKQRYPYAGTPNAVVELYVKPLAGGEAVKVDLGANPDFYLARVNWSHDGKTLYVQRLSRNQQVLDLLSVDPKTGASKMLLSERSDTWVELHDDFRPLKSGGFIWASERDGNKHLYLYDSLGRLARQITKGDWPVGSLAGANHANDVNEKTGELWFTAAKDTPLEHRLYKTSYVKPGAPVALTPAGGWWKASVTGNGAAFIGSYSDPVTPEHVALYDGAGKRLRWIEENRVDENHPWFSYKDLYPAPEFGTIAANDGQALYWSMLKPKGFDPAKKYPVVVCIYGGPGKSTVQKAWVAASDRLFQDAGFIVFSLDNRGTPNRSVKFGRAIYKSMGGPDIDDQIQGARWLQAQPYVDSDHIGIMGWSYGGFVALMAITAKDTPFAAAAAGAPPTEWSLYDTAYTERYMAKPEDNVEGYAKSDALNRLDNLKPGALLLMHGMADDNVLLSNTTRVMAGLQKKSIPFELMLYPGERHGVRGNAKNLQRYRLYLDFFNRKLKPEG
jgi:dipeptidyl-peptidase 4